MGWVPVLREDELPDEGMAALAVGPLRLVVCRWRGELHAYEDRCPHAGGPLSRGNFTEGRLICRWHGWEFLCETGQWDANPAVALRRMDVRIQEGMIWVDA